MPLRMAQSTNCQFYWLKKVSDSLIKMEYHHLRKSYWLCLLWQPELQMLCCPLLILLVFDRRQYNI
jgi:hypothetical protein